MDRVEGYSLHNKSVDTNQNLKIKGKKASKVESSKVIPKKSSVTSSTKIKQRKIEVVDHEFAKLALVASENYKGAVNLLINSIQLKLPKLNDDDARRLAHSILQLNLPKKQKYAKELLAEIAKGNQTKFISTLTDQALLDPITISYEFLHQHKIIPESFLNNFVYKHLAKTYFSDYGDDIEDKLAMIKQHAKETGIRQAKDFSFKRMLKLKNILSKYYSPIQKNTDTTSLVTTNPDLKAIKLSPPNETKYCLDDIDKKFITKLITEEKYFKIKKFDILKRLKRKILHSKRHISQTALSCVVVAMVSSTFTFGISLFGLAFGVSWAFLMHGITSIYKFAKAVHSRKVIEQQKLPIDNIKNISDDNKKELKKFINACSYVCSYDGVNDLLHTFAEFEKIAEKIKSNKAKDESIESIIEHEQQKAIYQLRKQDLYKSLSDFSETSLQILHRLNPQIDLMNANLDKIWDSKFKNLSDLKQKSIFTKVIAQPHLKKYRDALSTSKNNWLVKILPFLENHPNQKSIAKVIEQELAKITDAEVNNNLKVLTKAKSGLSFLKSITVSFAGSRLKMLAFYAVRGMSKAASYGKYYISSLVERIKTPINYAIDWVEIIVFTLLGIAIEDINTRINNRRLAKNSAGEKVKTGIITKRDQTEREELYLLKINSEKKLAKLTKQLLDFVKEQENLNKQILETPNIEEMDDEQAAEIFIKYSYLKQSLEENLAESFIDFYNQVAMKTEYIEREMHPYDMQEF